MKFETDIQLSTARVLLRPYHSSDLSGLATIAFDETIWKFMPTRISNQEELQTWAATVEAGFASRTRYTFAIIDKGTGELAGSTSYGNMSLPDKRLEIGWTWLSHAHRGTGLNRHCKYLLLRYAFEELGMERVELKTDVLNQRSRRAMLKIGATEEGVLRSHTHMHDGRRRDTIYYSILKAEWPDIKEHVFSDLANSPIQS